jgi:uncharacterized protein (TIGR03086 family)
MTDIAALHRSSLEATRAVVAAIEPDQLECPTPCAGWDVRTLLNHVISGNFWAAELAAGKTIAEVGDRLDGDVLGGDPLDAYDRSAKAAAVAFEAPGALEAPCAVSYGPVPGAVYAGHRFIDVLVHGWDLARATGQDTTLDPALVDGCLEVALPQQDMLTGSGMFGASRDLGPGAAPQARLLALMGRA